MSGAFIAPNCDHHAEIQLGNGLGGVMDPDDTQGGNQHFENYGIMKITSRHLIDYDAV